MKPNFAYVNTGEQRVRKDNDWVLHVAWGPGGRVPPGSADLGDPSRAREAIELLAEKMKWNTAALRQLVGYGVNAQASVSVVDDGSLVVLDDAGSPILTIDSTGAGNLHDPSQGAAAVAAAMSALPSPDEPAITQRRRVLDLLLSRSSHPARPQVADKFESTCRSIPFRYRLGTLIGFVGIAATGAWMTTLTDHPAWIPAGWVFLVLAGWFITFAWHSLAAVAGTSARSMGIEFEQDVTRRISSVLDDSWTVGTNVTVGPFHRPDLDIVVFGYGRSIAFDVKWTSDRNRDWQKWNMPNRQAVEVRHDLYRLRSGTTGATAKLVVIRNGRHAKATSTKDAIPVLTIDQTIDQFRRIQAMPCLF